MGEGVFCFFSSRCTDESGKKIDNFDELISALENEARNDELRALIMSGRNKVKAKSSKLLDQVVRGRKRIQLFVIGGGGKKAGPIVGG